MRLGGGRGGTQGYRSITHPRVGAHLRVCMQTDRFPPQPMSQILALAESERARGERTAHGAPPSTREPHRIPRWGGSR